MLLELHLLQNFAPSNLNRDDTNSPKQCEFGGYRRARISSQCLKRAMRTAFGADALLPPVALGIRTKRLADALAARLSGDDRNPDEARAVAETALRGMGLDFDDEGKTQYLVFLGEREIAGLARVCNDHWDALASAAAPDEDTKGKAKKKAGKERVPKEVAAALEAVLNGGKAADVALFGRMLADLPERNVDAAAQVAHAISTHRVGTEFDFYTAIDDLKPEDTAGADMIGTVEYNAACFYRYALVDLGQLAANLVGDDELTRATVAAFLRAAVHAIPTGKQNSMAAHNKPSLVMAVLRETAPENLANAFVRPVSPGADHDLVGASVRALDQEFGDLRAMYGDDGVRGVWVAVSGDPPLASLSEARVGSVAELVGAVMDAVGAAA